MSENELVKFGGSGGVPMTADDLVAGLQTVNSAIVSSGGPMLLRLKKSGVFAYGQENIEPEPGSLWAINPYSFEHGWCCWVDGELLGEVMVPFNELPPAQNSLHDYGEPWKQQVGMMLQCMTGQDKGTQVRYKGTSVGLRNAFKELTTAILTQIGHDKEHIVPVVELEVDSYIHKRHGETFFPVLEIQQWVSISDAGDSVDEEGEDAELETEAQAEIEARELEPEEKQPERATRRKRTKPNDEPANPRRRRRRA